MKENGVNLQFFSLCADWQCFHGDGHSIRTQEEALEVFWTYLLAGESESQPPDSPPSNVLSTAFAARLMRSFE